MEFLQPDVYTEEVRGQSATIGSPSTSTFAIAGYSPRGPEGKAIIVTSFAEFVTKFGGFTNKSYNAYIASAFFSNGGTRLVFVRELHSDATAATGTFTGDWDIEASGRGAWANGAEVTISGNPNYYAQDTASYSKFDIQVQTIDPSTGLLVDAESYEAVDLVDVDDPDYLLKAVSQSEYTKWVANNGGIPSALVPTSVTGFAVGTGDGVVLTFNASLTPVPVAETTLQIIISGSAIAVDDGLGALTDVSGGPSVSGTVNYDTGALVVFISPAVANTVPVTANFLKKPAASVMTTLTGGADGTAVIASDLTAASLKATKRGIYALDDLDEQMQLALPDFVGDSNTTKDLIAYAEGRKDIFVIDAIPKGNTPQQAVNYKRNILRSISSYAGLFYPWISVADPLNKNRPKIVPPVGHVAGRFAYNDTVANVGKAPAGTDRGQLQSLLGLEKQLSKTEQGIVYQAQINHIRTDANVGTAIFGNKTLQIIGDFTDINVRRLFIFLAKAQYVGLLDILFEDVGPTTFGLISARLDVFLNNLFLGNVIGSGVASKAQAYKIICDETNNPAPIQQQKRIVIDEFIKPNLATEFIHLRLQKVFDATEV